MSSNLANILALFLIIPFILFSMDLIGVQETYSQLEHLATQISIQIQKTGYLDSTLANDIETKYNVQIDGKTNVIQNFGDFYEFSVYKYYVGNFINDGQTLVKIKRVVLIGYVD